MIGERRRRQKELEQARLKRIYPTQGMNQQRVLTYRYLPSRYMTVIPTERSRACPSHLPPAVRYFMSIPLASLWIQITHQLSSFKTRQRSPQITTSKCRLRTNTLSRKVSGHIEILHSLQLFFSVARILTLFRNRSRRPGCLSLSQILRLGYRTGGANLEMQPRRREGF